MGMFTVRAGIITDFSLIRKMGHPRRGMPPCSLVILPQHTVEAHRAPPCMDNRRLPDAPAEPVPTLPWI
ncbi:MAG: hypothetical protein NTX45_09305 [Proteobacteria bacterium]|nr:hypothetical protein [Pseudomonadota bacterium]